MGQRRRDVLIALAAAAGVVPLLVAAAARADSAVPPAAAASVETSAAHAVVLPTAIVGLPRTGAPGTTGPARAPTEMPAPSARVRAELEVRGREIDLVLADAAQDLGMVVDLAPEGAVPGGPPIDETELAAGAPNRAAWLVAPSLEARGNDLVLRMVASPPHTPTLLVRTETVAPARLTVRAVVMLRDLFTAKMGAASTAGNPARRDPNAPPDTSGAGPLAIRARSNGRATLALNGALFGGFIGYSVQRSSGSDDPRLLYPLTAIGTGIGIGASMVVADEWDVGLGDAWFVAAGAWWPALAGFFIARGDPNRPPQDRYAYALVGGGLGIGATTVGLSFGGMSEGGALLAHSGATFGMLLGGAAELYSQGSVDAPTPYRGAGYGTAAGVLIGGTLATLVSTEPARVLAIDLGAGLGGLAGAAAASPLLFGQRTAGRDRAFLAAAMGGTVVGGGAAALFARGSVSSSARLGTPILGLLGSSQSRTGQIAPIVGFGWSGTLE